MHIDEKFYVAKCRKVLDRGLFFPRQQEVVSFWRVGFGGFCKVPEDIIKTVEGLKGAWNKEAFHVFRSQRLRL